MDSCMDGYYDIDKDMSRNKAELLKKIMKSAISVSKSKVGRIIIRDNRWADVKLKKELYSFNKQRCFSDTNLKHKKTIFLKRYAKHIDTRKLFPAKLLKMEDELHDLEHRNKFIVRDSGDSGIVGDAELESTSLDVNRKRKSVMLPKLPNLKQGIITQLQYEDEEGVLPDSEDSLTKDKNIGKETDNFWQNVILKTDSMSKSLMNDSIYHREMYMRNVVTRWKQNILHYHNLSESDIEAKNEVRKTKFYE